MSRLENLAYIDALRGLAISGVLSVHLTVFGNLIIGFEHLPFHFEAFLYEGRYGVALFFVVSAYTLARSLEGRMMTESYAIRKYFLRRFFRIAPAFYLVLLLVFFVKGTGYPGYVNPDHLELTWIDLLTHMTFTNGFFPYYINDFIGVEWSVATEFGFYLVLPFIMFALLSRIRSGVKFLSVMILFVMTIFLFWLISTNGFLFTIYETLVGKTLDLTVGKAWSYLFIGSQLHVFIVGIIVWLLTRLKKPHSLSKNVAFWGLLCCLLIAILFVHLHSNYQSSKQLSFLALPFWAVMSGLLIIFLDIVRPRLKWLEFLGRISFSLYLVHFFIGEKTAELTGIWHKIIQLSSPDVAFSAYFLCNVFLSTGIAFLMYQYIERPGIRYGVSFIRKRYA